MENPIQDLANLEPFYKFFDPWSKEILSRSLFVRPTRRCRYCAMCIVYRKREKSLEISGAGGRKDGAWCTGWLIQGEPVVETLGEHGMRTRVTISIATHVGVSGAINKLARARAKEKRFVSLARLEVEPPDGIETDDSFSSWFVARLLSRRDNDLGSIISSLFDHQSSFRFNSSNVPFLCWYYWWKTIIEMGLRYLCA